MNESLINHKAYLS